jgi:Spy/CpxP family protein refolding chaperone
MTSTRTTRGALALVLTLTVGLAAPPGAAAERGGLLGPPTFLRYLFRPEHIMSHQTEIALTPTQREAIQTAMRDTRAAVESLRWDYEAASEKLGALFAGARVDERAALDEAARMMAIEQKIKRAHLGMLIRVKNVLTAEQQARLQELQPERRRPRKGTP